MGARTKIAVGVLAVVAVAAGAYLLTMRHPADQPKLEAVLSTPPGVTFQWVKVGKVTEVAGASSDQQALVTVFGDPAGKTLYSTDRDVEPGKSSCAGECATTWPPAIAPGDAKPVGHWSVVKREDGAQQWAYKGKPLYTYAKDEKIGDGSGQNVDQVWHMAALQPADGIDMPYGVAIQEIATGPGQGLVDAHGRSLYVFDGRVEHGKAICATGHCGPEWRPLPAGQLANPIGDFTIVAREDGVSQWAYKGRPLYLYAGDAEIGDANGKGVDRNFELALVERYFLPSGVSILPNERKGGLLTNAEGKTLYARDRVSYNGTGGHSARGADRGQPQIGMQIGLAGCDAACAKDWTPLAAPADALPSGYWSVMTRTDGSKQWGYQGYALYTYAGDRKPGDTIGQDMYDLVVNDSTDKLADARYGLGLYWRTTSP
jgi:predicted lipoprotein with Yx(FWY)xxD motif